MLVGCRGETGNWWGGSRTVIWFGWKLQVEVATFHIRGAPVTQQGSDAGVERSRGQVVVASEWSMVSRRQHEWQSAIESRLWAMLGLGVDSDE